jgi:hypothetical protein
MPDVAFAANVSAASAVENLPAVAAVAFKTDLPLDCDAERDSDGTDSRNDAVGRGQRERGYSLLL